MAKQNLKQIRDEMLRFGLIRDYTPQYESEVKEIQKTWGTRIADYRNQQNYYARRNDDAEVERYQQKLADAFERKDKELYDAGIAYEQEMEKMQKRIKSPKVQSRLFGLQAEEVRSQQAAEQERMRQEREGLQREEAERQAGRFRARGSRAAGRPMLSAARIAPQQPMAPNQTLGEFMPK